MSVPQDKLIAELCREMGRVEMTEVVVEVAELRRQRQGIDAGLGRALAETLDAVRRAASASAAM